MKLIISNEKNNNTIGRIKVTVCSIVLLNGKRVYKIKELISNHFIILPIPK